MGAGIHLHILHPQLPFHAVEPEDVLHPEHQLLQLEGLHQIVVRPHVEPAGLVGDLPLRGDEDGRDAVLPQVGEQLVPVNFGQHDVQQRQGVPVLLNQVRPRLPIKGQLHLIPGLGQGSLHELGDVPVVLYDQNAVHTVPSSIHLTIL